MVNGKDIFNVHWHINKTDTKLDKKTYLKRQNILAESTERYLTNRYFGKDNNLTIRGLIFLETEIFGYRSLQC